MSTPSFVPAVAPPRGPPVANIQPPRDRCLCASRAEPGQRRKAMLLESGDPTLRVRPEYDVRLHHSYNRIRRALEIYYECGVRRARSRGGARRGLPCSGGPTLVGRGGTGSRPDFPCQSRGRQGRGSCQLSWGDACIQQGNWAGKKPRQDWARQPGVCALGSYSISCLGWCFD